MFWNAKVRPYLVDVLMLLPVIALAVAAFHLVEQDREGRELQVTVEAERLLEQVVEKLDLALNRNGFPEQLNPPLVIEVSQKGELVNPAPYNPLPQPAPFNLTEDQLLWVKQFLTNAAQNKTTISRLIAGGITIGPEFARLGSRERAWLIHELAFAPGIEDLRNQLLLEVSKYEAGYLSEAGLPLNQLAQLYLLRAGEQGPHQWSAWCVDAVAYPSPLTPIILSEAQDKVKFEKNLTNGKIIVQAAQLWEQHQQLRELWNGDLERFTRLSTISSRYPGGYQTGPGGAIWRPLAIGSIANLDIYRATPEKPLVPGLFIWPYGSSWLIKFDTTNRFLAWNGNQITNFVTNLVQQTHASSGYLAPWIEFSGRAPMHLSEIYRKVRVSGTKGTGVRWKSERLGKMPNILAETRRIEPYGNVSVKILFTNPEVVYAALEERTTWLQLLIGGCSLLGVVAVISNRRAVRKEARLNRLKSNFISSVSHELRAPVAAVRLMAENLENGVVTNPAEQEAYYKLIHRECRRLSRLIGNLLDFARIEQNRREYSFDEVSLEELALDTLEMVKPLAEEAGVQLTYESGADVFVKGDRDALQQALTNLLDNAIKHSAEGQEVQVGITDLPSIWVQDSGPGIPAEEQEKIFERFYRCGNELRRKTEGVGIGLTIVRHIVEAHRGNIRVESSPGKGARFTITLQEASSIPAGGAHA